MFQILLPTPLSLLTSSPLTIHCSSISIVGLQNSSSLIEHLQQVKGIMTQHLGSQLMAQIMLTLLMPCLPWSLPLE
jgi:hypothetical protein